MIDSHHVPALISHLLHHPELFLRVHQVAHIGMFDVRHLIDLFNNPAFTCKQTAGLS